MLFFVCVWLLSLNIIFVRFTYRVTSNSVLFVCIAIGHSIVKIQNLFIHAIADKCLGIYVTFLKGKKKERKNLGEKSPLILWFRDNDIVWHICIYISLYI